MSIFWTIIAAEAIEILLCLSCLLGGTEAKEGPGDEQHNSCRRNTEGQGTTGRFPREETAPGLQYEGHGVDGGDSGDPTGQQLLGYEHGGQEEDEEDGGPYDGTGLLGTED